MLVAGVAVVAGFQVEDRGKCKCRSLQVSVRGLKQCTGTVSHQSREREW